MNKKEYKRKVAELLSFKSPNSKKHKELAKGDSISLEQEQIKSDAKNEVEEDKMASPATKSTTNDKAQSDKKRDVIIIGAGLSGKFRWAVFEQVCRII